MSCFKYIFLILLEIIYIYANNNFEDICKNFNKTMKVKIDKIKNISENISDFNFILKYQIFLFNNINERIDEKIGEIKQMKTIDKRNESKINKLIKELESEISDLSTMYKKIDTTKKNIEEFYDFLYDKIIGFITMLITIIMIIIIISILCLCRVNKIKSKYKPIVGEESKENNNNVFSPEKHEEDKTVFKYEKVDEKKEKSNDTALKDDQGNNLGLK